MIANEMGNFVQLNIPTGLIYLGTAAAGLLFTILAILIKPSLGFGFDVEGVDVGMNWPIWIIMIILAIVTLVGGYMKFQESK